MTFYIHSIIHMIWLIGCTIYLTQRVMHYYENRNDMMSLYFIYIVKCLNLYYHKFTKVGNSNSEMGAWSLPEVGRRVQLTLGSIGRSIVATIGEKEKVCIMLGSEKLIVALMLPWASQHSVFKLNNQSLSMNYRTSSDVNQNNEANKRQFWRHFQWFFYLFL